MSTFGIARFQHLLKSCNDLYEIVTFCAIYVALWGDVCTHL